MMRMIRYRFVAVVVACLSLVAVARAQETSVGNPQDDRTLLNSDGSRFVPKDFYPKFSCHVQLGLEAGDRSFG